MGTAVDESSRDTKVEQARTGAAQPSGPIQQSDVNAAPGARSRSWARPLKTRLLASDALVVVVSVVLAQLLRFGVTDEELRLSGLQSSYWIISVVLALLWLISLAISQSRALPVLGVGNDEYRRVINSTMATFGLVAICAMLLKMDIARGYLAIALPVGLGLLLVSRHLWRQWLVRKRTQGAFADRALIVGTTADVVFVANKIIKNPASGYHLVGAAVRSPNEAAVILDEATSIPIVSSPDKVVSVVERHDIDTVIVAGSGEQGHRHLKELSWALEESNTSLVVASKLVDVAGPRIHWRPVEGLPLMSVELPQYGGSKFSLKRAFDVLSSGFGLLCILPVLAVTALAIKIDSPGPILFKQQRIGLRGEPFSIYKFRSMYTNAEEKLLEVMGDSGGMQLFYKSKDDPRITRVGRFIRRYSIDELPQLWNVFNGTMSMVGPRPQIDKEVELYDDSMHRRLYVKPGITGLWQVSGRSDLDAEQSIRLDLYYVENWSLAGDLTIIARTVKAVVAKEGAY